MNERIGRVPATVLRDPWTRDEDARSLGLGTCKGLILAGVVKMIGAAGIHHAVKQSEETYGASHPVTKALLTGNASAGGFLVPPDQQEEIIELLRPESVVRASNPRLLPMPRGTMTLPGQNSAATAGYGGETASIPASQPGFNAKVATYKKLTAFVPISNDLLRYGSPQVDGLVRDDLVQVVSLREDKAFLFGDGLQDTPKGMFFSLNNYAGQKGGTSAAFSSSSVGTYGAGGNWITSNPAYSLATVVQELAGAINALDTANVPDKRRCWFMHPRTRNYLKTVQNALGEFVFRDELKTGKLLDYPVRTSTQIATNLWDATGANKDLSFVILCEMTESVVFDSMTMEIAVSNQATYVDTTGAVISGFQRDQTLLRTISEHDFQMRHDEAIAAIQAVRWAPATN